MVILVSFYTIIRNLIMTIISGNFYGLIPIAISILMLLLVWYRHEQTKIALIGWALYFIFKYGISFVGLLLSHGHNRFIEVELIVLIEKAAFLVMGIVIWIGAEKYVEVHEEMD